MNFEILVNKNNLLDYKFVPNDLVVVNEVSGEKLDKSYVNMVVREVYESFKLMQKEALKYGFKIFIDSSYRSYEYQMKIFIDMARKVGVFDALKSVAIPGASEHQTGLAIDIIYMRDGVLIEETDEFAPEIKWLKENAYKFGFILRYPKGKESVTGFKYEPWHYRYVGINLSNELFKNDETMEEYYNRLKILTLK